MPGQCGNLFTECRFSIKFFIPSLFVREKYSFVNYLFGIGTTIEKHTSDYRR